MRVFRKDADYATRCLIYLAMQGGSDYVSTTTLSEELGLPRNFLKCICTMLIKAKILETREGVRGGVRLAKKPDAINLLELIELFDNKPELNDCTIRKKPCPNRNTCLLRKRILGIEDRVSRDFAAITIQTLIDDLRQSEFQHDHVLFSM